MYDAIVVGCGLSGSVVARELSEKHNKKVLVIDRRNHIGGNMYDYYNEQGILVHQYGPHTFHTNEKALYEYMLRFADWDTYQLTCGAIIDKKYTPTPFNFQTVDDFFEPERAARIKEELELAYPDQEFVPILELLSHESKIIREYAEFLYQKDYSLYAAKQWGVSPTEIDPSIFKRVPVRLNYNEGYFVDKYQVMPRKSYSDFFDKLLSCDNISIQLNTSMDEVLEINKESKQILYKGELFQGILVYTGAVDELLNFEYGTLPYRSLRFEWKTEKKKSFQDAPVVAYPQEKEYTRITEYTKLPYQEMGNKTTYALEYSIPYKAGVKTEPYYPVLTQESQNIYEKYKNEISTFPNVYLCGRLADFKYYNMDQALARALETVEKIVSVEGEK